ncbi:MAG TPA: hypothetical protein VK828_01600 [Terriglobales bacterium]|jgi:hypothetical protein|nr:hypothetical protein [Terriglobales bacterium]
MAPSPDHPIPHDLSRWKGRERAFLIGAPLAIVPALGFLPAVTFLIVLPRIAHGRAIGLVVVPACALMSSLGLWKLALGAVQKPWGLFNALSVGALVVLLVIAGYTGLFLALMTLKL